MGQTRWNDLAATLRGAIQNGDLRPGDKLPPETVLATQWQVCRMTAHRALSELQREGLVERRHRVGTVVRQTPEGPFIQVSTVSVLPSPTVAPKEEVHGVKEYGPDLVRLEAQFSPDSVDERRALLAAEAPYIKYYDYADAPGYGIVRVEGATVTCDLYEGATQKRFRTLPLTDLLRS